MKKFKKGDCEECLGKFFWHCGLCTDKSMFITSEIIHEMYLDDEMK